MILWIQFPVAMTGTLTAMFSTNQRAKCFGPPIIPVLVVSIQMGFKSPVVSKRLLSSNIELSNHILELFPRCIGNVILTGPMRKIQM